jgi:uncharacterized protein (DUF3084 family)
MNGSTVGLIISGISCVIAVYSVVAPRRRKLDAMAVEKAKRELADADAARELKQKERDEERAEREAKRQRLDDERAANLRKELGDLSRISNQRFRQWQEAIGDLDELWTFLEDEVLPWTRQAYGELKAGGSKIKAPPSVLPRRMHTPVRNDDDDDHRR